MEKEEDKVVRQREEHKKAMAPEPLFVDRFFVFHGEQYYPTYHEGPLTGERRPYNVNNYTFNTLTARMKELNEKAAITAKREAERLRAAESILQPQNTVTAQQGLSADQVTQMIEAALANQRAQFKAEMNLQELQKNEAANTDDKGASSSAPKPFVIPAAKKD
jgi:hypothetical protein